MSYVGPAAQSRREGGKGEGIPAGNLWAAQGWNIPLPGAPPIFSLQFS